MPLKNFRPLTPSAALHLAEQAVDVSKKRPERAPHRVQEQDRRPQRLRPRSPPATSAAATSSSTGSSTSSATCSTSRRSVAGDRVRSQPHRPHRPPRSTPTAKSATSWPPRASRSATRSSPRTRRRRTTSTVGNNFPLGDHPAVDQRPLRRDGPRHAAPRSPARPASRLELVAVENGNAQLKMPSGEIRLVQRQVPRHDRRRRQRRPHQRSRSARPAATAGWAAARTSAAWP